MSTTDSEEKGFLARLGNSLKEGFKTHILFFILSISIICMIASLIEFNDIILNNTKLISGPKIQTVFLTIGTILLSSGAFTAITKSKSFIEIFKNTLQEIVYNERFLKNQKNIDEIWEKITKTLCDQNFDGLSNTIFENIKKSYLPINNDFYYEDYSINIIIQLDPTDEDYVIISEETKCKIKTKNNEDVYKFRSGLTCNSDDGSETTHNLEYLIINGEEQDLKGLVTKKINNRRLEVNGAFPVKGKKTYNIKRKENKRYNFKLNPNRIHTAIKLYKDMDISVHFSNKLEISFIELGTTQKWEKSETKELNNIKWYTVKTNNVIFINQGYLLNIRKI